MNVFSPIGSWICLFVLRTWELFVCFERTQFLLDKSNLFLSAAQFLALEAIFLMNMTLFAEIRQITISQT